MGTYFQGSARRGRDHARPLAAVIGFAVMMLAAGGAAADGHVSVLLKEALPEISGKQATLLTVEYPPGGTSSPHYHPGSVFAYVLRGTVVSQLQGEEPVTYHEGQSWYESPKTPHIVSRNASTTEPATLLVLLISEKDESLVVPIK